MRSRIEPPIVRLLPCQTYSSKRAVLEAIGEAMVNAGAVTPAYVEGMFRKEQEGHTVVTAEVALPHGTADSHGSVLRNAIVIAPIPEGVEWAPGHRVRLAIGFAGTGDSAHLRLIASVARVLADGDLVERLKNATDAIPPIGTLFDLSNEVGEVQPPSSKATASLAEAENGGGGSAPFKQARGAERGRGAPASDELGGVQGSPPFKQ